MKQSFECDMVPPFDLGKMTMSTIAVNRSAGA